ncbi:MAG: Uma2 family endonuclease [Planctomycetales bacterium]|nr:Uma2 family endonuclease [Planctomycetales bacterium]
MTDARKAAPTGWDYTAYAAIPYDGRRHEIIGGDHFVNPAPSLYHQQVSRRIQFQLYGSIELQELGVVIDAPVDVQLGPHDIVQPDLVVVTRERKHILTPIKVKGTPDLIIEILSPSNYDHDLKTKREMYQRCRVPEYWIVFADEHQVLQLVLADDVYTEHVETDSITMAVPPGKSVNLTEVW